MTMQPNNPNDPNTPQLSEKDFIQEQYKKNPYPLWLILFLLAAFVALVWQGKSWYAGFVNENVAESPFLQVTNRNFSLFLWENPDYMRVNAKNKANYLTGFQYMDKVSVEPEFADRYVVAPPEVIFRYHTWNRLVSREYTPRPISIPEFVEFLASAEEWDPKNWPSAPPEYVALVDGISKRNILVDFSKKDAIVTNLQTLPDATMPQVVKRAFQGWKNYYKEGDLINRVKPTFEEMDAFLDTHPHYARNFWKNIVEGAYPHYLESLSSGKFEKQNDVPNQEMTPFLKVAIFNYLSKTI